jgi:hypothetical protein
LWNLELSVKSNWPRGDFLKFLEVYVFLLWGAVLTSPLVGDVTRFQPVGTPGVETKIVYRVFGFRSDNRAVELNTHSCNAR